MEWPVHRLPMKFTPRLSPARPFDHLVALPRIGRRFIKGRPPG
jgi:hypothetical protein